MPKFCSFEYQVNGKKNNVHCAHKTEHGIIVETSHKFNRNSKRKNSKCDFDIQQVFSKEASRCDSHYLRKFITIQGQAISTADSESGY